MISARSSVISPPHPASSRSASSLGSAARAHRVIAERRHRWDPPSEAGGERDKSKRRHRPPRDRGGDVERHPEDARAVDGERAEVRLGGLEAVVATGGPMAADETEYT